MKKQLALSETQLTHIAEVEIMIVDAERALSDARRGGYAFTAAAYNKRIASLRARIEQIREGVHFGFSA